MPPIMMPPPQEGAAVPPPTAPYPAPATGYGPPAPAADAYATNYNTDYGAGPAYNPQQPAQPSAPVIFAPYPDMPPPTYNEAFGAGAKLQDDEDNDHVRANEYKPLYPTYQWNFEKGSD